MTDTIAEKSMKNEKMETGVVNSMKSEISHDNTILLNIAPNCIEEEDKLKNSLFSDHLVQETPEQDDLKRGNFYSRNNSSPLEGLMCYDSNNS
jgi:hypothetical protein